MAIKNTYYTATAFAVDVAGKFAGWAKKAELPTVSVEEVTAATGAYHEVRKSSGNFKIGDIKFTYNIADSSALLDWIQSVLRSDVIENDGAIIVADINQVGRRRVNWIGGHIVDLKLTDLDAASVKNPFGVDVTVKPRSIEFTADSNKISAPQPGAGRALLTSNFRVQGMGSEIDAHVMKVTWPSMKHKIAEAHYGDKLLPDLSYAGLELGKVSFELTATAYPAIEKLMKKQLFDRDVNDSTYIPIAVEMLSTDLKKTLATITMTGCHLQEVKQSALEAGDKMSTITCSWTVEHIDLKLQA